jgi:PEP-CTERM motif
MKLVAAVSALTLGMGLAHAASTSYNFDSATVGAVVGGGAATASIIAQPGGAVPVGFPGAPVDVPFASALTALGITASTLGPTSLSSNLCGVNPVPCHQGGVVNVGGTDKRFDTGWGGAWSLTFGGSGVSLIEFLFYETESTSLGTDGFRVELFNTSNVAIVGGTSLYGQSASGGTAGTLVTLQGLGAIGRILITDLGSGGFASTGDGVQIDNIRTDTIIAVGAPEPSTYLMIGSALAGLAIRRRRAA